MPPQNRLLALPGIILLTFFGLFVVAYALVNNPPGLYFTDNILSPGPSPAMTPLEQGLIERLDGADTSIDMAVYGFNRLSVRDALIAAHQRGVVVRLVTDDEAYADPAYQPTFAGLEAAGIPVINDNRSSIMHNKFAVIDGEYVWSGSTNLTDNGFTYNHNNALVFTSTLLADIYTLEFEEMFVDGLFGTAKTDNVTHTLTVKGLPLEVYFSPSDEALAQVLTAVAGADDSIHFGIFFYTDDTLRQAMIERLNAGVTISGVWDALGAGNLYSEDETLCQAGADIKVEGFGGLLHHKFMIIDAAGSDPLLITGSMNWSAAGDEANDENILLIHDAAAAQAYLAAFQELYAAIEDDSQCVVVEQPSFVYLPLLYDPVAGPTPTPPPPVTPSPSPTPSTMPTTTPTPMPGDIRIMQIVYNPEGDDVQGEYVQLENLGETAQDMALWTLRDEANHVYQFPPFSLMPGASVRVWTKSGLDTSTDLYWGSGSAIWNNTGDTAYLRDAGTVLVDSCTYAGGGMTAVCE